jgi:hypothetical protein
MGTKEEMELQYSSEDITSIRCPYCEQDITGDSLTLMAHGIACRQQWEIRQEQIQNKFKYDKD